MPLFKLQPYLFYTSLKNSPSVRRTVNSPLTLNIAQFSPLYYLSIRSILMLTGSFYYKTFKYIDDVTNVTISPQSTFMFTFHFYH
ncbi:hypothetical protein NQ317_008977 [Molorchus minor]|uniref:Uncharacterized protein n=1 Tax=Molorchus minor TaxID=1323400 RepID=A0ABQ9JC99_9CUCU|nr:hypothetical protein NQ317_008977 [Molorchus minor]